MVGITQCSGRLIMNANNEASGVSPEPSTADVIIQQKDDSTNLLDKLSDSILEQFEDRIFPCNIQRDENGKKKVSLPKNWTDTLKEFDDFDASHSNSIAIRTGKGIVVIDVDTKELKALETNMQVLVKKWLTDRATFTVETTNGYHFYFDSDNGVYGNSVRVSDFVDIRGDGGCVFCYSDDLNSNYEVICDAEPLPLTSELLQYLKAKEKVSVAYSFDESNRKIALKNGLPNPALKNAVDSGEIDTIIKAASSSFSLDNFKAGADGLYASVNKLIYILAINPSVENEFIDTIVELLVTEKLEYDMNSPETTKRLSKIYSTLVWSNEEDVIEVDEEDIFKEDEATQIDSMVPLDNSNQTFPKELEQCKFLFDWLMVSDTKTHSVAALTALITVASAVTARGYYTHTRASTSLFTILISPTGSGKNMVVKAPENIMNLVGQGQKIIASKISSEGAMDDIFKMQNIAIHVIDEFGDQLGQMLGDKGGYLKVVSAKMKNLYSLTNGTYSSSRYSSAGGKNKTSKPWSMKRPCYGITGMTTKSQLLTHLHENMLHDGFLNRFMILNGQNVKPQFNSKPYYEVPTEIITHIKSIKMSKLFREVEDEEDFYVNNSDLSYFEDDGYKVIKLSSDAFHYYEEFIGDPDIEDTDIHNFCKKDEDEVKRAISIRWRENTIRLATALTAYEKLEVVSLDVLQWCYHLVKGSSIGFISMFEKEAAGTKHEQQKMKAIQWFKNQEKDKWFSLSYLAKSARPFSSLKSRERKELLDDLVESGLVSYKENKIAKTIEHLYKLTN